MQVKLGHMSYLLNLRDLAADKRSVAIMEVISRAK
jgi:hypothetical protein